MKLPNYITTAIVAVTMMAGAAARGQVSATPPRPPQPILIESPESTDLVRHQVNLAQAEQADREADFALAQAEARTQAVDAQVQQLQRDAEGARTGGALAPTAPIHGQRLAGVVNRVPGNHGGTLIIPSSDGDPKEQQSLEEDMPVMARVLSQ